MFTNQSDSASKKKGVKAGVDVERGKSRREDMSLSLRTRKRDELLDKRRNMGGNDAPAQPGDAPAQSTNTISEDITVGADISLQALPMMVEKIKSENLQDRVYGTQLIRKLLSVEENPPFDAVIESGAVPIIVEFLRCHNEPRLQFEAAWAITNIASGTSDHTLYVIQTNAVPLILELLASPEEDVVEQAIWAVGNIAGDGARCRDYILGLGIIEPLLGVITNTATKCTMLRNAVWALSNLCRGKPVPDINKVGCCLPVLVSLLHHYDNEVVTDACWTISYLSDGPNDRVQRVIQSGAVPRLVQLLVAQHSQVQTPAIRTLGNIVTGNDQQTQTIINHGALPNFHFLITHPKRNIRKEVCWAISNIAAGTKEQIQALINANLIPAVIKQLSASEFEVRKEAAWTFSNLATGGSPQQVRYCVEQGVIAPLCELLSVYDSKVITVALEALENMLRMGAEERAADPTSENPYVRYIAECGGLDKIEQLQNHNNNEVYHQAMSLLDTYFETEDATDATAANMPTAPMFGNVGDGTQMNPAGAPAAFSF